MEMMGATIGVLTRSPLKLHLAKYHEGSHLEIVQRLFPTEFKKFEDDFSWDEEETSDEKYEIANDISRLHGLARIVIENGKLYFNTDRNVSLTDKQLSYLKNYCLENGLRLIHSGSGVPSKEISLIEKKVS